MSRVWNDPPLNAIDERFEMTEQEVLRKAVGIAVKNGYAPSGDKMSMPDTLHWLQHIWKWSTQQIIFNHSFAKALWGTADIMQDCIYCKTPMGFQHSNPCPFAVLTQSRPLLAGWKYHLQQMVIADDPIKYLGEHL